MWSNIFFHDCIDALEGLGLSLCFYPFQRCSHGLSSGLCRAVKYKHGTMKLSKISLYVEALRVPFIEPRGQTQLLKKQPHNAVWKNVPLAQCKQKSIILLAKRTHGIQIEKYDVSLQSTCLHCSGVHW